MEILDLVRENFDDRGTWLVAWGELIGQVRPFLTVNPNSPLGGLCPTPDSAEALNFQVSSTILGSSRPQRNPE